jgi:hypothetical protein
MTEIPLGGNLSGGVVRIGVSCAKAVEALPRIFGHAVDLCHKVEVPAAVTCADGHG